MAMMKWFRKHNKKILVVGGALLMLAFLMPRQPGCGPGRGKDYQLGQAFQKQKIMRSEEVWASRELAILAAMGMPPPVADPLDYVLLIREARQMHIPAGSQALSDEMAAELARTNKVTSLGQLARKLASDQEHLKPILNEKLLRRALGNYWAIVQAERLVLDRSGTRQLEEGQIVPDFRRTLGLAQPSEKELELMFRNIQEKIDVEYVALPAWDYGSQIKMPSESQIKEHYDTYKEKYAGTEDNEFGLGYKQQARVKLEYIKVDVQKLIQAGPQTADPRVLREYYDQHKELYLLAEPEQTASQKEPDQEDSEDSPAKVESPPAKRYQPFSDVYDDVEKRWFEKRARTTALTMIGRARSLARARWEQLRKEQPNGAVDPAKLYPYFSEEKDTESLVSVLSEQFKVSPQYVQTGWIDVNQADNLPGIGLSYTASRPPVGFLMLLATIIRHEEGLQQSDQLSQLSMGINQDSPLTLTDVQGNAFLFRVIGLSREEILSSEQLLVDKNMNERVTADVVGLRAYEYAQQQARKLLEGAQKRGLQKALAELGQKNLQIRQTGMIARAQADIGQRELQMPLVNERGQTLAELTLSWQVARIRSPNQPIGPPVGQPVGILRFSLTNKTAKGRITALGLNLPLRLRVRSPQISTKLMVDSEGIIIAQIAASNAGPAVPAGPEGYSIRYFGRGIDAGRFGKFDLLISTQDQQLVSKKNLEQAGIAPNQNEVFQIYTRPERSLTATSFARNVSYEPVGPTGIAPPAVARLETGGKSQLLRAIFPADMRPQFLKECFAVLNRPGLLRKPAPKEDQPADQDDPETPAEQTFQPDLLSEGLSGQPPTAIILIPRQRICYVASVPKHLPLAPTEFRQARPGLINVLTADHYTKLRGEWWNSQNIRQRTGYKPLDSSGPGQEAEE